MSELDKNIITACACIGPMYGESHCICVMRSIGLPLNEPAREAERIRSQKQMAALFAEGGLWHKPKMPVTLTEAPTAHKEDDKP